MGDTVQAALTLAGRGEIGRALHMLSVAMSDAGLSEVQRGSATRTYSRLVGRIVPDRYHPQVQRDLLRCFARADVDTQQLARVTATLLLLKPQSTALLARDPLWIAFLTQCLNVDPAMEARLTALRGDVFGSLREDTPGSDVIGLAAALALQAFAGGYLGPDAAIPIEQPVSLASMLAFAQYRPLVEWPHPVPATGDLPDDVAALIALLVQRTVTDLREEAVLAAAMPRIDRAARARDAVSTLVQEQYRAHPYPRWTAPPAAEPVAIGPIIARLPGVDRSALPPTTTDVLIAGCGTGYEALDLARRDTTLRLTALDLSDVSLAYAQRMARRFGVDAIRFAQGDILDLSSSPEQYDVVISTGVLHHMARPADGLSCLARVLRPGGMLRLGLYSTRARTLVRQAHALIERHGWSADRGGAQALRAHILGLSDDDPLAPLRQSDDFYSVPGCIDLLFHASEQSFTLPRMGEMLDEQGLTLAGLDIDQNTHGLFRQSFGQSRSLLDLAAWDSLEARHPHLFAAMVHLWAQLPR